MARLLVVWIHVVAAAAWVGGLLYGSHLVVPGVSRGERAYLSLLTRGRLIAWAALFLLLVTGLANLAWVGLHSYWLMAKILLVLVLVSVAARRDFGLLSGARRAIEQGGDPRLVLGGVRRLDRITVLLALIVLFLAVGVTRGR